MPSQARIIHESVAGSISKVLISGWGDIICSDRGKLLFLLYAWSPKQSNLKQSYPVIYLNTQSSKSYISANKCSINRDLISRRDKMIMLVILGLTFNDGESCCTEVWETVEGGSQCILFLIREDKSQWFLTATAVTQTTENIPEDDGRTELTPSKVMPPLKAILMMCVVEG